MGVSKVVFSGEKPEFQEPDGVKQWLEEQTDGAARVILNQIAKQGFRSRKVGENLEYTVYGESILTSDPTACEIFDGVTIYYGSIPKNIPDFSRGG